MTKLISKRQVEELEALERAATKGPWTVSYSRVYKGKALSVNPVMRHNSLLQRTAFGKDYTQTATDAELIAQGRDALPYLLATVRKMAEALAETQHALRNAFSSKGIRNADEIISRNERLLAEWRRDDASE